MRSSIAELRPKLLGDTKSSANASAIATLLSSAPAATMSNEAATEAAVPNPASVVPIFPSVSATSAEKPRCLVLVGAGHSHVEVLKVFGERAMPGVELILVTRSIRTPYSGMLPGFVSGQYAYDEIHIDAAGLARHSGAELIVDDVTGLDPSARQIKRANGPPVSYDVLSLDIGSTPNRSASDSGIPVKPIGDFVDQLESLVADDAPPDRPFRIVVVGTGPAGVELAFALDKRLRRPGRATLPRVASLSPPEIAISLVGRADTILPGRSTHSQHSLSRALRERCIDLETGFEVVCYVDGNVRAADGRSIAADTVLWATESTSAPWLRGTGLALDARGFVAVDESLRSRSHPDVFAAGDIASLPDPRPKAGVFAVREGPVLAENLRRAFSGEPPEAYKPQRDWLTLLSRADGRAVADKWGLSLEGRWVWWWKDWNDRRFVKRYNRIAARASEDEAQ